MELAAASFPRRDEPASGEMLPVASSSLPRHAQQLFRFASFNAVQTETFDIAFGSDAPLVVSAPTGSGKTVVLELAMARLWATAHEDVRPTAVYIAPLKALTSERFNDWQPRFGALGIRCCELVGDSSADDEQSVQAANLIVTTPEKWDAFTRFRRDADGVVGRVGLLMIDEIHLLHDKGRGPTLESIIARMKLVGQAALARSLPIASLRVLAISATIANIDDIAQWISPSCVTKTFDERYRPVPLQWHVVAWRMHMTHTFDKLLASRVYEVVRQHSSERPSLVFCNSRKAACSAAVAVAADSGGTFVEPGSAHAQRLLQASQRVADRQLAEVLRRGVAFYSAQLSVDDKRTVEKLFLGLELRVVCSTTGLAQA